jgi:DNA polymerase
LRYLSPRIQKNEYGEELSFSGVSKNGGLVDEKLYGGKLTENIIQAISRDIMVEAMLRVWKAGYAVLFNVYDELVATAAENAPIEPMIELMSESPKWAPGLVLKAEGKKTKRYGK